MKAYSLDLRQKILDAYLNREGSIRELATRFNVSFRVVWGLINRFRHTGSYAPKPRGGNNPPWIPATAHDTLRRLVATHAEATLAELCEVFIQATQIRLRTSSMHRTLAKLKLTRKKRRFMRWNKKAPQSSSPVTPTGKPSSPSLPAI
jgi:transposase